MRPEYYQIKDKCRKELLKYLKKAVSHVRETGNKQILDIGCGTGVPTIWLAQHLNGFITAIDKDDDALKWLQVKVINKAIENRITVMNISFFDLKVQPCYYDIILAEGLLNVIGFEKGFVAGIEFLKEDGYFIIHDEYKDHEIKSEFIRRHNCNLISQIFLDESVWWNDYYKHLEVEINSFKNNRKKDIFKTELREIELFKRDPMPFKSIYFIVKKLTISIVLNDK